MSADTFDTLTFFSTITPVEVAAMDASCLKLILMPTEKCNLRCSYCYEDFKHGKMSPQLQSAIIKLIHNAAPRLTTLELDWFGGEPLLAPEVIESISLNALNLCDERGIKHHFTATTNAVLLTSERLKNLSTCGVTNFQITLDGDVEFHDLHRVTAKGGGTFETILRNLEHVRESSAHVKATLRLHYTPASIQSVENLLRKLAPVIGRDARFSVFFHSVDNLGGNGGATVLPWPSVASKTSLKNSLEAQAKALGLGVSSLDSDYICYAARTNSFVIRSDGRVNKCTVALESPKNQIGHLTDDGKLKIDNAAHLLWIAPLFTRDRDAQHCPSRALHREGWTKSAGTTAGTNAG
jgi:uncharacterized protein